MISKIRNNQEGFALLITILTVSVIVAVVLSIIDLSRLQLKLAINSRDAEVAFAAANAGLECAQRVRRVNAVQMANQEDISDSMRHCFNTFFEIPRITVPNTNANYVSRYLTEVSWGTAPNSRCSMIDIIAVFSPTDSSVVIQNADIVAIVPHYNKSTNFTCPANSECTIATATGYNVPCSQKNNAGVLKREVLLEF